MLFSTRVNSIDGQEKISQNLTWTNTSQEIVSGLNPGNTYKLTIVGIGCKDGDKQATDPIQATTDSFVPAIIELGKRKDIILGDSRLELYLKFYLKS